jgi:hypothetical protein
MQPAIWTWFGVGALALTSATRTNWTPMFALEQHDGNRLDRIVRHARASFALA